MKLTSKAKHKLVQILDYIEKADKFIQDENTLICTKSSKLNSENHYTNNNGDTIIICIMIFAIHYTNNNGDTIHSIFKPAGNEYCTMQDAKRILMNIIHNGEL